MTGRTIKNNDMNENLHRTQIKVATLGKLAHYITGKKIPLGKLIPNWFYVSANYTDSCYQKCLRNFIKNTNHTSRCLIQKMEFRKFKRKQ